MDRFLQALSDRASKGRVPGELLLQRIYMTTAEMLNDRGVRITSACANSQELQQAVDEARPVLVGTPPAGQGKVSVVVDRDERTGIKTMRPLMEVMGEHDSYLLISIDGPTPFCKKEIPESEYVQYFLAKELIHNISRHALVPPHRALSAQEADEVLQRYAAVPKQLPLLLMQDPVRRYYNFAPSTIVEIARTGISQEASMYYRRVAA